MNRHHFCMLPIVLLFSSSSVLTAQTPETNASSGFRIVGYLPEYRFADLDRVAADNLTDLILFSAEVSVDGSLDQTRLKNCPWNRLQQIQSKHGLDLFLTIGGWGRSENFAAVAQSDAKRQRFVSSTVRFALDHHLDGIDLDWEHPKDASEEALYALLLGELQKSFKPHGLQLTVTIAPWQRLSNAAVHAVDRVQVMSYDHDEQHSTLEQSKNDLRALVSFGIPVNKLVLGLPFYGRDVQTRAPMTYAEIISQHHPDPKTDQVGNMYFNGPTTIRQKTQLAIKGRLAGVMVWEVGQDAPGEQSLLSVIRDTVSQ